MLLGTVLFISLGVVGADTLPTREEALTMLFPGASIRSERIFLTKQQLKEIVELAKVDAPSSLIVRYSVSRDGKEIGRAYPDTHVVRTKKETLLICLNESGEVQRVEVTAFLEPLEYLVDKSWYEQFQNKTLSPEMNLQRAIRPVAGATLTARAANQAVRRVLAIDQILEEIRGNTP